MNENGANSSNSTDDVDAMFAGMTICQEIVENMETKVSDVREIWLGDSGASSHIKNHKFKIWYEEYKRMQGSSHC